MKNPFMDICPFLLPQSILIVIKIILLCTRLVETTVYQLCELILQLELGKSLVLRDLMTEVSKVIIHMVMM